MNRRRFWRDYLNVMGAASQLVVDELLVMRCQDGEAEALTELVDRCGRLFWSHALHLTGSEEGAWDAVQESWLAIIRGIRRLRDPALFRPWAYRIVTHKAADWVSRRAEARIKNQGTAADEAAGRADSPTDDALDMREALSSLPQGQRALLTLYYLEEFSLAEIAMILDIPEGTVKSRLFHARNAVRERLEKHHE